jgi:alcohol dehydrogenase class IV
MQSMPFEKNHFFYSPCKVVFGPGSIRSVGAEAGVWAARKALIVTDPGVVAANLLGPVKASLEASGIGWSVYDQVKPEPPVRCVEEGTALYRSEGCDIVIGMGGGSSLDVAKGVSILAANGGAILDYCGLELAKKRGAPKILIPTTAGTGSEITRVAVYTNEKENVKTVVNSFYCIADVAIVDPLLTLSLPPRVTADSGIDALVHVIETYVSMSATPFSDVLAEGPIEWVSRYLPMAWAKGSNQEARYYVSLAATMGGMAFASGALGAVHALAYPVGTEFHLSHGRSNAIMLPHVMRYNLPGCPEKYAAIAELMGKETEGLSDMEAAQMAVEAVEELLATVDVSCRLRDYGIPREALPKLVEGAMKFSRLFITNPRDLTEKDVKAVFEAAY